MNAAKEEQMGNHDKKISFEWEDEKEPQDTSYTKAEIFRLAEENAKLKEENHELKKEASRMEKVYADVVKAAEKVVARKDAEIASLKKSVVKWKGKALALVDDYVQVS